MRKSEGVLRLRLTESGGKNPIGIAWCQAFADAVERYASEPDVRVIVVESSGSGFSVGGDAFEFAAVGDELPGHIDQMAFLFHQAIAQLHEAGAPVLVAVRGLAAGGGFSLVMGADLVVAAESAVFVSGYTRLGLTPDGGATWFLPRAVGSQRAFSLLALSPRLDAAEAQRLGLVTRVVPDDQLDTAVDELVTALLGVPSACLADLKALLRESGAVDLQAQLKSEQSSISRRGADPETRRRIAAFTAGRSHPRRDRTS